MAESTAKAAAGIAAALIAVLAGFVVVWPGIRDFSLGEDVYERRTVTETTRTEGPAGTTIVTKTIVADDSSVERALGDGGLLLVRIGVAAAAAFLAGAVVLRILLGRYGFKAGGLELEDVTTGVAASAEALTALTKVVDELTTTTVANNATALRTAADALALGAECARRLDELAAAASSPRRTRKAPT